MPVDTSKFAKLRRVILAGAALAWAGAMGSNILLDLTYFDYPRNPNPEMARTVPYEVKRIVVYITEEQSDVLLWLRWIEIASGALIFVSLLLNQKWPLEPKK